MTAHTLAQKILQTHTSEPITTAGQIVRCKIDIALANDITAPLAIKAFRAMGATNVFNKDRVALVMDHFTPQKDIDSANQVRQTRLFAQEMGITHYYEAGEVGVEHALLPEKGIVGPWDIVVGADSHTCTYGGLGAFATGLGSTDVAAAMALGETWFKVPPTIRVNFEGTLPRYVTAKDLILLLIGKIGVDGALYKALEFGGSTIDNLSIEGRLTMANMAIEAGGKVGLFAVDQKTIDYAKACGRTNVQPMTPDKGAVYEQIINFSIDKLSPVVACPHLPSNIKSIEEVAKQKLVIQQSIIGSCTNGRIEDLRLAAEVLKGRKVDKTVRCIVMPATPSIWKQALREGLVEIFLDAGCIMGPATCGPCLGGHMGILGDNERSIATTNRNFKGRMGSLQSEVYLSNPALAAASAVLGYIASPTDL